MGRAPDTPLPVWLDTSHLGGFAGRHAEKKVLDEAWDQAVAGRRQVVLIGGPPGIGKSRLAAEVASAAHGNGAVVAHGVRHTGQARPFEPFVQIFDQIATIADTRTVPGLAEALTSITAALSPAGDPVLPGTEAAKRHELFAAVVTALRALAADQPTVLVLDDVHNATEPTCNLASHIMRSIDQTRLLVLMTFRTTLPERTPLLARVLATAHRLPAVTRLDLSGLDETEIEQFLATRAGPGEASARTARLLRHWTAGNPYYVSEVWASVGGDGSKASAPRTPPSLSDAVRARVLTLSPDSRSVVRAAAVSAPEIDPGALAAILSVDIDRIHHGLDEAVAHGLMVHQSGMYDFVHDLTRHTLQEDMAPSEVTALHGRIADLLIAERGDDPACAARISQHLARAGSRRDDAVQFGSRAGDFSERTLAFEDAADQFENAAALAEDTATREILLLRAGHNLLLASRFEQALEIYRVACGSKDPERRARAAIGLAEATWRPGRLGHEAIARLKGALKSKELTAPLRTELSAQLARAYGYAGLPEVARQVGDAAVVSAREIGDPALLAVALISPGYASPQVLKTDLDSFVEASSLARQVDDLDLFAQATLARASTGYALGERRIWQEALADLEMIAERTGQPFHHTGLAFAMSSLSLQRGQYDEALGIVDRVLQYEDAFTGLDRMDGLHGSASFHIKRETGLEDIRPLVTGDLATEVGQWKPGLLALYTELDMRRSTAMLLDEIMSTPTVDEIADKYEGAQAVYLTEAVCLLKHRTHAERLYKVLSPRSGTNLISGFFVNVFGSADRYLGMLAEVAGRDAADHFETALEMDASTGATHHRAESLARYARYLRNRDPDRAEAMAQEAYDLARLMGSRRIQRLARPTKRPSDSVLTGRELEVLELIAAGCSNRDISERLFISVNTAANHVRNILTKTGAKNRTEAARLGAQRGLLPT